MTMAFMGLTALVLGERVNVDLGAAPALAAFDRRRSAPSAGGSIPSPLGLGDLRLYGLVQFLPMLLLPLVLLMYPPRWSRGADYWMVGGWYLLAKLLELFDRSVFKIFGGISGHTLKHLAAAMAAWWLLRMFRGRVRL